MKIRLPLLVIAILVLAATAAGLLSRTGQAPIRAESLRGQPSVYRGDGLYRYNPEYFAREGVIWDAVNLAVGLPLFIMGIVGAARHDLRGKLLLGGMLAYFWYVYLGSVMMYAFNNLFLVYVAIVALCPVAFVQNMSGMEIGRLPAVSGPRFPRRTIAFYGVAISVLLTVLWVGRAVGVMQTGRFPAEYAGMTTLGSQALDLALLVPLGICTAVFLLRASPWGWFLASIMVTIGFMMFITIPMWIVVPLVQDGRTSLAEGVPFFLLSVVGIFLAAIFYGRADWGKGR